MSELQSEMMTLWDEAHILLRSTRLDRLLASQMINKLLDCAERAREAGYFFGERPLKQAVTDLQERLKQTS